LDTCCDRIEVDQESRLHHFIHNRGGYRGLDSVCIRATAAQIMIRPAVDSWSPWEIEDPGPEPVLVGKDQGSQ
jgi:hypothetical protein